MLNVFRERFIQELGIGFEQTLGDFNSCGAQFCESSAFDLGIRILHASDYATNTCSDNGINTGRSASLMTARLEIDVERGAASLFSRLLEGENLRVLDAVVGVGATANDFAF